MKFPPSEQSNPEPGKMNWADRRSIGIGAESCRDKRLSLNIAGKYKINTNRKRLQFNCLRISWQAETRVFNPY
jgi:hypothetical protein